MTCRDQRPADADAYLRQAPAATRPVGEALRALIRRRAPRLREVIKWSFICYEGRRLVCCVGVYKGHASLSFFRGAELKDPRGILAHGAANAASRTFKATAVREIPVAALERLLVQAVHLDAETPVRPRPRAVRPEIPMPDDVARALALVPKVRDQFERLPRHCRREFLDWIVSARRPETRARRLTAAVEMIARGERRG